MRTRLSPRLCVATLAVRRQAHQHDVGYFAQFARRDDGRREGRRASKPQRRVGGQCGSHLGSSTMSAQRWPLDTCRPAGCVESPAGAMGVHSANPSLTQDESVDSLQPEVPLICPCRAGPSGSLVLQYSMTALVRSPVGAVSPWFDHSCPPATRSSRAATAAVVAKSFDGPMPGHGTGMPWHYDLRRWVWQPNPTGTFAQFNPSISCAQCWNLHDRAPRE